MTNTMMTLDTAMQDLITKTVAAAETAGDFVVQEAPIVVEQLLAWHFAASLLYFASTVLSVIVIGIICKKNHRDSGGAVHMLWMFPAFMVVLGGAEGTLLNWLKIAIAPKLYLLEYAADLIK